MSDPIVMEQLSLIIHLFVLILALRAFPALRRAGEHGAVASVVGIIAASLLASVLYALGVVGEAVQALDGAAEVLVALFHLSIACVLLLTVVSLSHLSARKGKPYVD